MSQFIASNSESFSIQDASLSLEKISTCAEPHISQCEITLSPEFNNKLNLCLSHNKDICDDSEDEDNNTWILGYIQEKKSLLQIANKYNYSYDGEYASSTCGGLFDAYIQFKQNRDFDTVAASYLSTRAGVLASSIQYDADKKFIGMIYLTVKDLILELDGTEFFSWLNKLAEEGDKILYPIGTY